MNIRWLATWTDNRGREREYLFIGPDDRVLARLDFQLKLIDAREPVPNQFEIEQAPIGVAREEWRHDHRNDPGNTQTVSVSRECPHRPRVYQYPDPALRDAWRRVQADGDTGVSQTWTTWNDGSSNVQ